MDLVATIINAIWITKKGSRIVLPSGLELVKVIRLPALFNY